MLAAVDGYTLAIVWIGGGITLDDPGRPHEAGSRARRMMVTKVGQ
jgi:hypothetical protein